MSAENHNASAPDHSEGLTPAAVLLVDDDAKNLLALESVLDGGGYDLVQAQTSDKALLALMNGEFAAIVLDVQMPDISGIDLARLIKQRKRTQHIPIIFLTAHYREDEHAVLGYDVGAVDYLTKPVNPTVLRSKVNVFVDLFRKTHALAEMNRNLLSTEEALRVANAELAARNAALEREAEERTRRIRAESAQAEAEAANAAKDRFLAMLSHELRTPLSPILHAVSLLEETVAAGDSGDLIREAVATIQRNVRLEARLIDDLLDLARVRNGKLFLEMQSVDAHEVLRQAIQTCRQQMVSRQIKLEEHLDATATHLRGDPARLQQVFWNLLSNAAKFTPEGGAITVRTSGPDAAGQLVVEISDTGKGIAPEKIGRVFDAFEQASSTASAGLGLGLAIGKALVESHGGRIEARSEGLEMGATFSIRLPVSTSTPGIRAVPVSNAPAKIGLRLLLVEDHHDTLKTLERLLLRRGYVVRSAESMEIAEQYEFDLLVSDIGLPDGRGTDLLGRLEERHRHPFRAIAMSGFGTDEDLERSFHAGFAEHLTKPVEFSALHQAITRLVSPKKETLGSGS
jgi:signal transduction histidine kinase